MNGNAWAARTDLKCLKCGASTFFAGEDIDERERWKDQHYKDGQVVCVGRFAPHIRSQVQEIIALGRQQAYVEREMTITVAGAQPERPFIGRPVNMVVLDEVGTWPNSEGGEVGDISQLTPELNGERRRTVDAARRLGCNETMAEAILRRAQLYVTGDGITPNEVPRHNPTRCPLYVDVGNRRPVESLVPISSSDFEPLPEGDRPSPAFIDFMNDLLREMSPQPIHGHGLVSLEDMVNASGTPWAQNPQTH